MLFICLLGAIAFFLWGVLSCVFVVCVVASSFCIYCAMFVYLWVNQKCLLMRVCVFVFCGCRELLLFYVYCACCLCSLLYGCVIAFC